MDDGLDLSTGPRSSSRSNSMQLLARTTGNDENKIVGDGSSATETDAFLAADNNHENKGVTRNAKIHGC